MPTSSATARATASWSPVSRMDVRLSSRNRATASAEESLTVSATTTTPRAFPSQPTATVVPPGCLCPRDGLREFGGEVL